MNRHPSLSRRTLLAGGAALTGLAALDPVRLARAAQALPPLSGDTLDIAAFLALSRALSGHDALDERLGSALLAAFEENSRAADLAAFYEALRASSGDSDAVAALLAAPETADVGQAVLRGWYVGLVDGPDGLVRVGYEETLMGVAVGDFLQLRSNCGGLPHFWAEPPELADLPVRNGGMP